MAVFRLKDPAATWRHLETGAVFVGPGHFELAEGREIAAALTAGVICRVKDKPVLKTKKNGSNTPRNK